MPSDASASYSVEITSRDLEILRGFFEARVMTAEHVAAIYFGGRYEAARKRLSKLKTAGYVGERPRRTYDPAVLFLTKKAFVELCKAGTIADLPHINWPSLEKRVRVSALTLAHELGVQDVRAAFSIAAANSEHVTIAEFRTWPLIYQFKAFNGNGEAVAVKPDGFIRLHEKNASGETFEHLFFLEVDRSTEPQATLANRAAGYRDYYRRGGLAVRHGRPAADFEQFPFRVLIILKNAERRNNTAENLLLVRPPILTQATLTTFAEVTSNPLGPIWVRPIDYRAAITGSAFECQPNQGAYRRQTLREDWVDMKITKHPLIIADTSCKNIPELPLLA
jgi:hypothetical protein